MEDIISPQNLANDGKFVKFYPNGGNGELENAIFIGKDGSYNSSNPDTQSNHPGQGNTDQVLMQQ